jgi:hypothetical protein
MADRTLDRTAVRKIELAEEGRDVADGRSRPPGERLAVVTSLVLEHHGKNMPEVMERTVTVRKRGEERPSNDDLQERTPAECVSMVWPLTQSAWAFKEAGERSRTGEDGPTEETEASHAQQRLPRHLVRLRRRGG